MILINEELLWLTVVLNYKNNNWVANVQIQILSFSYPTDKILKTSNSFGILSKKKEWTNAGVPTTNSVGIWKAIFFVRINILRLIVYLQGWQSKGYEKSLVCFPSLHQQLIVSTPNDWHNL